jgi:uncharacterized RDD family membrane protein YckC
MKNKVPPHGYIPPPLDPERGERLAMNILQGFIWFVTAIFAIAVIVILNS